MKIIDAMSLTAPFVSFEFFPPKNPADWDPFFRTAASLAEIRPLFASVTYGAGGSIHGPTLEIVSRLTKELGLLTMAHLTCINSTTDQVALFLRRLEENGIRNVLALRGDPPAGESADRLVEPPLRHASDLVTFIRTHTAGFGVAVAAYPEPHPEAPSPDDDLRFLKLKLDAGADFAVTQLFFDNATYFDFVERARRIGIRQPIIPGILPVISLKVIDRIISLCGATIPPEYRRELENADRIGGAAAVREVGVRHAREQIAGLMGAGVPGVHVYTLNRGDVTREILDGII